MPKFCPVARDEMAALARPPHAAILTAHVALQLMDWRGLRPAHDVEGHRLMRVAAEALALPDSHARR